MNGVKIMKILKSASAGTVESSDAYVEIEPGCGSLNISIESVVKKQFGDRIESSAKDVLNEYGISDANIRIVDRGALDCVIRARVETAILRAKEN
jgi:citrate lyase subunit gamma (acyl carrier protein)